MNARHARVVLQAVSVLLQYPDEERRGQWPTVRAAVSALPALPARGDEGARRLLAFCDAVEARTPRELAEDYVAVFDRRRRCCLYLTWWSDGETRRRGASLASLKERYTAAGLVLSGGELPDYLPVVCEYAATTDLADGLALLQEHRPALELLRLALADAGTPHVLLLEALCALLPGPSPRDRAAAQQLARTGPPVEQVGLEPFSAALVPTTSRDGAGAEPVPGARR